MQWAPKCLLEWAPKSPNGSRLAHPTMWGFSQSQPMISQGTLTRQTHPVRRETIFSERPSATCGSLIQPQIYRKLECDASDGKSRYITAACRRGNSELPCVCSRFTLPGLEELPCRGRAEGLTRAPRTVTKTHFLRGHNSPFVAGRDTERAFRRGRVTKSWNLEVPVLPRPPEREFFVACRAEVPKCLSAEGFQIASRPVSSKVRHEKIIIF